MMVGFCLLTSAAATPASAGEARRAIVGTLADGSKVESITLSNGHGITAQVLTYGATLQRLLAPDRAGVIADVVLGHDDYRGYVDHPNYFGVTIGRYANRIANGRFAVDGKHYQLPLNDKTNSLHGGGNGFDKANWRVTAITSGPVASVTLAHLSPDGDSGFPGNLDVRTTYTLDDQGRLTIVFEATTDKPTIVNLTNHAFFNLAGAGTGEATASHVLTIPAAAITPVDAALVPTGALMPVDGTVFDFRKGRRVATGLRDARDPQIRHGRGYDHNFVIDAGLTSVPKLMARLEDPGSGRALDVLSTEPGIQVYTGNFLNGTIVGKNGQLYRMGDGIALEPQKFPNAPNQPNFASPRIDPQTPYRHVMVYRLSLMQ